MQVIGLWVAHWLALLIGQWYYTSYLLVAFIFLLHSRESPPCIVSVALRKRRNILI